VLTKGQNTILNIKGYWNALPEQPMNSPQQFARLGSYDIFDVKLGINENT
jgi:hypothetical protein